MKKILILGASGMAGHVIYKYLESKRTYEILGTMNSTFFDDNCYQLDIFDKEKVQEFIITHSPNIIINCIGSLIKESKTRPDRTIYSNSYFPYYLKYCAELINAKVIHLSTDCVFSGKTGDYDESSFKDASDIYGLSKSLGELNDANNLTIRTSIIGPEIKTVGEGLFHWFMNQHDEINGYKSNYWSGVTTFELAKFIDWELNNPQTGLKHLTNGIAISKFDLLHLFKDVYNRNLTINDDKDYVCDKSLLPSQSLAYEVPSYQLMLKEQKAFMSKYADLYGHYQY